MNYFSNLLSYFWDATLIMILLSGYFQFVQRLTLLRFVAYCLPIALFTAMFTFYLSEWTYGIIIAFQILINLRRKIPIISLDTIILLSIAIFLFIYGNTLVLIENKLRTFLINDNSQFIPQIFGIALVVALALTLIIVLILIRHYRVTILEKVTQLTAEYNVRKAVTLFLATLLFIESVIAIVADTLKIQRAFQAVIIICFVFFAILTVALMYYFIISYQRSLQSKHKAVEKKQQTEYLHKLEENYNELRRFRHDYQNILISLQGYLLAGDVTKSIQYIQETLQETTTTIGQEHKALMDLSKLEVPGIRQLLFEKIKQMLTAKIAVTLEIAQLINTLPGSQVDLARIIGALMDNALEAAQTADKPEIHIAIIKYADNAYEFNIENTLANPEIDIAEFFNAGYSTKQNHSGLGLTNVNDLVHHSGTFSLEVTKHADSIRFSLMMQT